MPKKIMTPEEKEILVQRQLLHKRGAPQEITFKEKMLQILLGVPPSEEEETPALNQETGDQTPATHGELEVTDDELELKAKLEEEAAYVTGTKSGQSSKRLE